jgi:hypothetical protein
MCGGGLCRMCRGSSAHQRQDECVAACEACADSSGQWRPENFCRGSRVNDGTRRVTTGRNGEDGRGKQFCRFLPATPAYRYAPTSNPFPASAPCRRGVGTDRQDARKEGRCRQKWERSPRQPVVGAGDTTREKSTGNIISMPRQLTSVTGGDFHWEVCNLRPSSAT